MSAALTLTNAQLSQLPWHDTVWSQLHAAWREKRWPHGLLLHGPEGVGKYALARRLANTLLCDRAADSWQACGECASCKLLHSGTHPDMLNIEPEEGKQQISVDQIREACSRLTLTSYRRGYKVALISPAHQMTMAAANSLLKTLEEPAPNTALILLTSRPGALLATLRSRCQQVAIRIPQETTALRWLASSVNKEISPQLLQMANGAPLRALAMANGDYESLSHAVSEDIEALLASRQDVTHIAKRWADERLGDRLGCVDRWLCARLRAAILGTADPITRGLLPSGAEQLNISRLYSCLDRVRALQAQLTRTALQRELAVDAVLVDLLDALSTRRH
jgi:DNA polymerase-3 subunit delta'